MTEKSLQSRLSRQSQVAGPSQSGTRPDVSSIDRQHGSLYSRAEKFFKTDYTMLSTPPDRQEYYLSVDERRERLGEPSVRETSQTRGSLPSRHAGEIEIEPASRQARPPTYSIEDWRADQASPVTEERALKSITPSRQYHGSLPSVQYSPSSARHPSQPRGSSITSLAKNRNLYPPRGSSFVGRSEQAGASTIIENGRHSSLSTQTYDYAKSSPLSPLRPKHSPLNFVHHGSPESPKASRALPREDQLFKTRLRALSVPKLQASWHAPDEAVAAARKGSLCIAEGEQLGPRGSSRGSISPALRLLQLRNDARSELSLDEIPTSPSALGLTRQSQVSRLGSVLSRASSQKSRKGSVASLSHSQATNKRLIGSASNSKPKTKGDWSSYLSEGLTLYVDQGGSREAALRMPYLSYDPFGRLDSLATGGGGGGSPPTIIKRGSSRPTSAGKGAQSSEDDVGLLEFARSEVSGPLGAAYFSPVDTAPILRHLGIGEDTKADLLTRQAALSVEVNGLHQVSGVERSGKVGWRFSYEISSIYRGEEMPERVLRPVSFVCSATLLDPERARKGRFLKMVKKGVATNIPSNLVQGPEGSERFMSTPGTPVGEARGSLRKDSLSAPDGTLLFDYRGHDRQSESVDYGRDEFSFTRGHEYRLASLPSPLPSPRRQAEPSRTPVPVNAPAGVLPFQLKSSRKVVTPPRTSSAAMSPSSSREHDLNELLMPLALEPDSHSASLARSLDSDDAIAPRGRASQTASEEIKMAYLRSSLQREEAAAAAAAAATAAATNVTSFPGGRKDSGSTPSHLNGNGSGSGSGSSGGTWPRFRSRRGESPSSPSSTRGSPLHQHFEARDTTARQRHMDASSPTIGKSHSSSASASASASRSALRKAISTKALPRTPREEKGNVEEEDSSAMNASVGHSGCPRGSIAAARDAERTGRSGAEKRNGGGGSGGMTMGALGLV